MAKKRVGRPKGSGNKSKATSADTCGTAQLALNQVSMTTAIKNLEVVVNHLTGQLGDMSARLSKLESPSTPEVVLEEPFSE